METHTKTKLERLLDIGKTISLAAAWGLAGAWVCVTTFSLLGVIVTNYLEGWYPKVTDSAIDIAVSLHLLGGLVVLGYCWYRVIRELKVLVGGEAARSGEIIESNRSEVK